MTEDVKAKPSIESLIAEDESRRIVVISMNFQQSRHLIPRVAELCPESSVRGGNMLMRQGGSTVLFKSADTPNLMDALHGYTTDAIYLHCVSARRVPGLAAWVERQTAAGAVVR